MFPQWLLFLSFLDTSKHAESTQSPETECGNMLVIWPRAGKHGADGASFKPGFYPGGKFQRTDAAHASTLFRFLRFPLPPLAQQCGAVSGLRPRPPPCCTLRCDALQRVRTTPWLRPPQGTESTSRAGTGTNEPYPGVALLPQSKKGGRLRLKNVTK